VIFGILFFFSTFLIAGANPHPIPAKIQKQMKRAGSWKRGCPVPLRDLSYLRLPYIGFDGKKHSGELIVHRTIAREVRQIFGELFKSGYPIHRMELVSNYGANDWKSIEADNTSAFNCRPITGGKKWSNHSYGKAIDINPIENPYIRNNGRISHKASYRYKTRKHRNLRKPDDKAMLIRGDKAVRIFTSRRWRWGAYFKEARDLQHFHK
jgi:hypothetical protein